jgi:hypothetical protein
LPNRILHATREIEIPVSKCIYQSNEDEPKTAPYFQAKEVLRVNDFDHDLHLTKNKQSDFSRYMEKISEGVSDDDRRWYGPDHIYDCLGIAPDIVLHDSRIGELILIEVKPYFGSSMTGNQGIDGAYVQCMELLEARGLSCRYIFIASISHNENLYKNFKALQGKLRDKFGIIFLEDIFAKMAESKFEYGGITNWVDYSEKGSDFKD